MVNEGDEDEVVKHVNLMHALNCLVAKLRDSAEDFILVKHYLTQINVLRQGKLGALNALMYINIRINDK